MHYHQPRLVALRCGPPSVSLGTTRTLGRGPERPASRRAPLASHRREPVGQIVGETQATPPAALPHLHVLNHRPLQSPEQQSSSDEQEALRGRHWSSLQSLVS